MSYLTPRNIAALLLVIGGIVGVLIGYKEAGTMFVFAWLLYERVEDPEVEKARLVKEAEEERLEQERKIEDRKNAVAFFEALRKTLLDLIVAPCPVETDEAKPALEIVRTRLRVAMSAIAFPEDVLEDEEFDDDARRNIVEHVREVVEPVKDEPGIPDLPVFDKPEVKTSLAVFWKLFDDALVAAEA
jgi:hypothetical protein